MRYVIWLMMVLTLLIGVAPTQAQAQGAAICFATLDGVINPAAADYVSRTIEDAQAEGCTAYVLRLNTPGGLMTSTWQIGEALLNAPLPTVVYISPQGGGAASAGVFITYAADIAAMAPGTNIGAAHPISSDGNDIGDDLREKVTNDAVARITGWARTNERNSEWAAQSVRSSVSIDSAEALRLNVINLIARNDADLLNQLDGLSVTLPDGSTQMLRTLQQPIRELEMGLIEQMLHWVADPTVATLLLSLGSLALYFELAIPGLGVSGILGGISLALGLYGMSVLPVNAVGIILLVLALVLMAVDIFATNHGILTFGAIISFVVGALLLIDKDAAPGLEVARSVIAVIGVLMLLVAAFTVYIVSRTRKLRDATGAGAMIGRVVPVRSTIAPDGMVFTEGSLWQARSTEWINQGEMAEIVAIEGLTLIVRRAGGTAVQPQA